MKGTIIGDIVGSVYEHHNTKREDFEPLFREDCFFTDDTVLTIAGMTGFSSIATFNRNFRRYVGMAPEEWRKNAHA